MALALALCAACSSKPAPQSNLPPLNLPSGCQPLLAGYDCFLPYPSDYFRVPDAGSPTGYLIQTQGAAKLRAPQTGSAPGASADIADFRPIDGYSTIPVVQAVFNSPISPNGFVPLLDAEVDAGPSLSPASNMLLIEADSATPVPAWVDLDPRALEATPPVPNRQAIVLHPLVALKYQTRYVVALHGVETPDGGLVPAPVGFQRLRDGLSAGDPQLSPLQTHFDQDIFPVINKVGIPTASLQLAWDFTTGDEGQADGDMIQVQQLVTAWVAQNPNPVVTITSPVQQDANDDSWLIVQGTVQGPLYETTAQQGSSLYRGPDGKVAQNGLTTFTFTANVPVSVRDQFGPGRTVSYGHGFFGSQSEVIDGETRAIAQVLHAVFFCIDWWGMSTPDALILASDILNSPADTMQFAERVPQAMANWIVMNAAIRGPLLAQAAFQRPANGPGVSTSGGQSNAGQPVYDGVTNYYLGISQGAILGTVLASLSPDFKQIDLNVGGAAFTQMMWRAAPFDSFLFFIQQEDADPLDQQKLTGSLQVQFDRIDPATYAPHVLQNPLPGSPTRRVLMQNGLGDLEVPNLGSYLLARQLGIPQLSPNDYPASLLPQEPAPIQGSAMTLWDFGVSLQQVYAEAEPAAEDWDGVHEGVRKQASALAQMDAFFQPGGEIIDPCDGGDCIADDAGLDEDLPPSTPDAGHGDAGVVSDAGVADGGRDAG